MYPEIRFGSFTAAASPADVTINLGFVPKYVKVWIPAATAEYELFADEGSGKGLKHHAASTYHNALSTGGLEIINTESIDTSGGTVKKTAVRGFKVPAGIQSASNPHYWMAIRES